jgi:hypothetical protein
VASGPVPEPIRPYTATTSLGRTAKLTSWKPPRRLRPLTSRAGSTSAATRWPVGGPTGTCPTMSSTTLRMVTSRIAWEATFSPSRSTVTRSAMTDSSSRRWLM